MDSFSAKYNLFLFCAWLFIIPAAIVRLYTKKDTLHTLKSRFSIFKKLDVHNETIWCHAASVGEFNTLETIIPDLKKREVAEKSRKSPALIFARRCG